MKKVLQNTNKGLTLIEIIISISILSIIFVPMSNLFVNSVKFNVRSKDTQIATQIAQRHIEIWKNENIDIYGTNLSTELSNYFNSYGEDITSAYIGNSISTNPVEIKIPVKGLVVKTDISPMSDYELAASTDIAGTTTFNAVFEIGKAGLNQIYMYSIDNPLGRYLISYGGNLDTEITKSGSNIEIKVGSNTIQFPETHPINVKIECSQSCDIDFDVWNKTSSVANFYVVKDNNGMGATIDVITKQGIVSYHQNVYDSSVIPDEKNVLYKVDLIVYKGDVGSDINHINKNKLVQMTTYKKVKIQ